MTINFSNRLIGLGLLTGNSNIFSASGIAALPSAAVLKAKAAFTAPATVTPWDVEGNSKLSPSQQLAQISAMRSIVVPQTGGALGDMPDVQTSFTAYMALANLQVLAEKAAKPYASETERAALNATFAKGMDDLKSYLATAPKDKVNLYFDKAVVQATSVSVPSGSSPYKVVAKPVATTRDGALAGLTGSEVLSVTVSRSSGMTDTITIDLATTPQPPSLDSVAAALNAAIKSVPMRDIDGNIVVDGSGNPKPRWSSDFTVEKTVGGDWGLVLNPRGSEKISIDQVGGKDTLMVVSGQTGLDSPTTVAIRRFDTPDGSPTGKILGSIAGVDRDATEKAKLKDAAAAANSKNKDKDDTKVTRGPTYAQTTAGGIATDAQGNSYVVGTTAGDLGANLSDGGKDLYLTKLDSQGKVIWQQTLGLASDSTGAAVTIAPNGDVVVSGAATDRDSDMLVARFQSTGAELFSTTIPLIGNETADAVAVGSDGTIYIGGQGKEDGNAFVVRLDATGKSQERLVLDSGGTGDRVNALAVDQNGDLLVLWRNDALNATLTRVDGAQLSTTLGSVSLGTADARALAVSDTGEIAVAGATRTAIAGNQVNGISGGFDGFVTRIDTTLGNLSTSYVGTAEDDQIDSVAFMNGAIYAGGRTSGQMGAEAPAGALDGFVARIDDATGAVEAKSQFGRIAHRMEPVKLVAVKGGDTVLDALGLSRGTINAGEAMSLPDQTSVRVGDSFAFSVDGSRQYKITIEAGETMQTLARKMSTITGKKATITSSTISGATTLTIRPASGHSIALIGGPDGKDALTKLGLEEVRINGPKPVVTDKNAPVVTPGGTYSLDLSTGLNLTKQTDAAYALKQIKNALSMTQTAYRSLYWDDAKEQRVNGSFGGGGSAYQQKQLANYQAALTRLTGGA